MRLEAAEQGIAATLAAYDIIEPKLAAFYGALSDEQKARLYRDTAASAAANAAKTTGAREGRDDHRRRYSSRRHLRRDHAQAREAAPREVAPRRAAAPGFTRMCEERVRCCATGRRARSNLMSGSPTLSASRSTSSSRLRSRLPRRFPPPAPPSSRSPPTGRMETMRKRLAAVRAATAAIRPALARFYDALDQEQKVRFSGMS